MTGAEQTADHITSGRCPFIGGPKEYKALIIDLDCNTPSWLGYTALDIFALVLFIGTRMKKKKQKHYTNKLTTILRNAEKIYYLNNKILDDQKQNSKQKTWKILKRGYI